MALLKKSDYPRLVVNEWITLMESISSNGTKEITSFNQVPTNLQERFAKVIADIASGFTGFDKQKELADKLVCRKIVEEKNPSLLGIFDKQFGILKI